MEKIEILDLSSLHNDEHYQFMTDVETLVEETTTEELGITEIYPEFTAAFAQEDEAVRIEQSSPRTPVIKLLDNERGQTWDAINIRVEATIICNIETEVAPAKALKRVIDLYGDKRKAPYNEESASLTNLVADLLSPVNKPHLEKLSMVHWVNALDSRNKTFQKEFNARNKELSDKLKADVRELRGIVDAVLVRIVTRINALIELNLAKPGTEAFVKELNEKIAYYKNTLTIRKGRKLAGKKDSEQPGN